jgi:hypothetical protein
LLVSRCCVGQDMPVGRWIGLVVSCGGALLIAGCGGSDDSSATSASETQPTGLTAIQSTLGLVAVGLGVDVLRSRTDRLLDKTNVCVRLGQSGDSNGQALCLRSAQNRWDRSFLVAGEGVTHALDRASGSCKVQLGTVLKRIESVHNPTINAADAVAAGSGTSELAPLLGHLDRALNRIDGAFARAQTLCRA